MIQPLPFRLALRQPVGEAVEALPDAPDLTGTAAVPHPDHPALGLGDHRVVEPAQGTADPAAQPPDEQPRAEQEQGDEEQPHLPGLLVALHIVGVADHGLPQQHGHGVALPADKAPPGEKGVGKPFAGEIEKFLGGIDGFALLQTAEYDLIRGIQHHGIHRAVGHGLADHQIAGTLVPVGLGEGGDSGIGVPGLDAGQFVGGTDRVKSAAGGVDQQSLPVVDGKGTAGVAGITGQALVIAGGQPAVGHQSGPVGRLVEPLQLFVPQAEDPPGNDQQREGEQQVIAYQQREQAAGNRFTFQAYTPILSR